MPSLRLRLSVALLTVAATLSLSLRQRPPAPVTLPPSATAASHPATSDAATAASTSAAIVPLPPSAESARQLLLERHAYSHSWDGPLPPAMAAFRTWAERYRLAPSSAARLALEPAGVSLARARRAEMRHLIVTDPQRALAVTVPATLRQTLPPSVLAELETRHAGRGDFALQASSPAPDEPRTEPSLRRIVYLHSLTYTAHPYGRREPQLTKEGASLHGIALDGQFALHESPIRILEPGETPSTQAEPACAGCAQPLDPTDTSASANLAALEFVRFEDRTWRFHESELAAFAQRALDAEDLSGPRVTSLTEPISTTTPPRAADAPTPFTVGTKQVLVIRVDFSDFPGEPLSQSSAQNLMGSAVKTHLEDMSYGQTTIVTTVTPLTYRMPRTGASYATANDRTPLHADARNLAAADYTLSTFDRIIVLFPNIGTTRVPGSQITFAGLANVSGTNAWINGANSFVFATILHELGHTYGLLHANLWRVRDSNATSAAGNTLEYGDPFDIMGSTSATGVTRDTRHHYSTWGKNRLGWLPDEAVATATRSGVYRIHRFDSRNSPRTQPLALRIFRDGVRWYWVGLRQNFATGTLRADGAHVVWGHNQRLQTQLLDLNTPGGSGTANGTGDAAIPVGSSFTDPRYGVTIKTLARGGEDPAEWLDIEVTIPAAPPNVVTAWGREGATFYDTESGEDLVPAPETNVPMDLTDVKALATGEQHVVALKGDGTVVAWGNSNAGQIDVPVGLANVAAVAAGANVSGAVLADGTVRIWGDAANPAFTPPPGLSDVVQLAFGRNHALALRRNGTVLAWGSNSAGQSTVPAALADVVSIATGFEISVALKRDGTVSAWGSTFARSVPAGLANVVAISSFGALNGGQFVAAVRSNGTVVSWGFNGAGQTNVPADLTNVVSVAAGAFHTLALKADGSVVAWGSSTTSGRLNVPRSMPRALAVAATQGASFALVGSAFRISTQPQAQTVAVGGTATLSIDVTGATEPVTYQWRKDGVAVAGATARTLTIAQAATTNAGVYDVIVTSGGLPVTSASARLTVGNAPVVTNVPRINNLSIRTNAGTGDNTLIVGLGLGGANTSGNKAVLIRGVGPTLAAFGITTALADPVIVAFQGQTQVAQNDDWAGTFDFDSLGAFRFSGATPRDAAIYNPALASGSYSIQVTGKNNGTGIALAEIYDATPASSFTTATPRLVNVSARTQVGTGDNILIAGFVISGGAPVRVLIRAVGPTLGVFGVNGTLADPRLEVYNSANVRVAENDNWAGTAALKAAFASVAAFAFSSDASRDAALVTTLPPGTYTAQISGVGGTSGVALVELYEVPAP